MGGSSSSWRWVKRHLKTAADHYRERRARRRRKLLGGNTLCPVTVDQIVDRDNLYECFLELRREGGRAPGIDSVTYDMSNHEAGIILGHLSAKLREGTYRPQPIREVQIPKLGSDKMRTLRLGVICDRIVGKALYKALGPLWEEVFLDCSWGFRPGLGPWQMLAALEAEMVTEDCWVLAIDDIKNAFDNVPIADVMTCHKQMLDAVTKPLLTNSEPAQVRNEKDRLLHLIETLLKGSDPARTRGIDQGAPYSPTALNALLHYRLDEPFCTIESPLRYHRYADNIVAVCPSVPEGRNVLHRICRLVRPLGLTLKQEDGVMDLKAGAEPQILGFKLQLYENQMVFNLGNKAYDQLRQHLSDAHTTEDPPTAARQSVLGWLSSAGPACKSGDADIHSILHLAAEYGFRELASPDELRRHWEVAWYMWQDVRQSVCIHHIQQQG